MIVIRELSAGDAKAVHEIGSTYPEFDLSSTTRFFPLDYVIGWFNNQGSDVLLGAYEESRLIGFVLCEVMRQDWSLWHNFFVLPDYRHLGVGNMLYKEARRRLLRRGVSYCVSLTRDMESVRFHENHGGRAGHSFTFIDWRLLALHQQRDSQK